MTRRVGPALADQSKLLEKDTGRFPGCDQAAPGRHQSVAAAHGQQVRQTGSFDDGVRFTVLGFDQCLAVSDDDVVVDPTGSNQR